MQIPEAEPFLRNFTKIREFLIGAEKSLRDPSLFHKISLIPILAWIGLGADGLSSSSYGPQEAFLALGSHTYLAIFLAIGTAFTVFIISYAYSRIIEHFPSGGGGYVVATHNLGERAGVISGSALLIDYILTISVSIAACADAIFSFFPFEYRVYKLWLGIGLVFFLIIMNLRGVKESVTILAPIFLFFLVFHVLLLGYGIGSHVSQVPIIITKIQSDLNLDLVNIGFIGVLAITLKAYSLGGGTYTGIEAVANGMQIMREPKIITGKRTMGYMAISLAAVSGGLFLCFLLYNIGPVPGRTLNAVLADAIFQTWSIGGWIAFAVILSEAILLIVGAQAGFIDGPRVMANMAIDSWLPRSFASLSERLTMYNGIQLMGCSTIILLIFTNGSVSALVVLYAINVFLTFSLSEMGMVRFYITNKAKDFKWKRHISIHLIGLALCITILAITIFEKFSIGGWLTLLITFLVVGLCYMIKAHYAKVAQGLHKLDDLLANIPSTGTATVEPVNSRKKTAVQMVSGFHGFGVETFLSIIKNFSNIYENFIFVSVGVVDSGSFKGSGELKALEESVEESLKKYVDLARSFGIPADYRTAIGVDVVDSAVSLCENIVKEFSDTTFFTGQVVFRYEHPFHKILHNETAFAIQRRLQYKGITTIILPIQAEK